MVSPIYILILSLAAGFLLSLVDRGGRRISLTVFYGVLAFNTALMVDWVYRFVFLHAPVLVINTAGFHAPVSINLELGLVQAVVLLFANLTGLLAAVYMFRKFVEGQVSSLILFLLLVMGVNGLVMTQDLFNMFVFLEILSISTFALTAFTKTKSALSAGFKYMMAGGVASTFFLLGVVFVYYFTGNLNLDFIHTEQFTEVGLVALFLLSVAVFVELKPFPANGWALDVYQSVDSGIASVIAVVNSAAIGFVFFKIMPLLPQNFLTVFGLAGIITFFFSNMMGLKQTNAKRLLGYSSIGQMGLLMGSLVFTAGVPSNIRYLIIGGFFVNHLISKAGLFWLSGIVKQENLKDWSVLRNNKLLLVLFGVFIFALSGFPPFAGFWAKWEFVKVLIESRMFFVLGAVLVGSLFELVFLFRWFTVTVKEDSAADKPVFSSQKGMVFSTWAFAVLAAVVAAGVMKFFYGFNWLLVLPVLAALFVFLVDSLPSKLKGFVSLGAVAAYGYYIYPLLESGLQVFFGIIFIVGSAVNIISTFNRKHQSKGFYGFLLMMIFSFGNLLIASSYLEFFLSWEFMTISSFLLILRGQRAQRAS
ncbi:MAG: hypothetical protein J7K88_12640, partial [Candidatus Fermentibacteraceae bacterium]|nr:hypothetical protein [Candidatus Fermentibacteraceae bacterium]